MKLYYLLLIASLFIIGCSQSKNKKSEKLIKEYLSENLNDFNSYDPVEFSSVDSFYAPFELYYEMEFNKVSMLLDEAKRMKNDLDNRYLLTDLERDQLLFMIDSVKEKSSMMMLDIEKKRSEYIPKFAAYKVNHSFRAKNGFGGTMLNDYDFYIDTTFSIVLRVEDNKL